MGGLPRHENADEVDQVVSGKGERQGHGARQDGYFQDVDFANVLENGHQDGPEYQAAAYVQPDVSVQVADHVLGDQRTAFQPLEDGEVGDGRQGQAAPDGPQVFE